ncbi:hypothetical protein DBR37_04835 [Herminiimonas sp. KBW02]|uniref:Panacea domain-containing protein n=1 Tax=Herminiimonas sp. KBW02 TaxID=2153363 RepID=UPI000F596EFE|nr:type II toxin-antitoxin system antitoxin SocA domain-containing protein [Herminiimonas sp. KBW02]RQO35706.1 hypothetical protein DBR37_04835 [Herminiimonas sp. KBW02]
MSAPLQVASEIVRQQTAAGRSAPTNLELQKLLYFCHGWHLALLKTPLVDESFEAWRYGPVLPSVYQAFKVFSSNPIPADHPLIAQQPALTNVDSAALVRKVLDVYGNHSGYQLVNLSHHPDGPWKQVWNSGSSFSDTIDDAMILNYFSSLANH